MEARTVLHVIETHGPGGAETVLTELVLRADPLQTYAFAVIPDDNCWLGRAIPAPMARYVSPSPRAESGPVDFAYARGIRRVIDEIRPHVVHAHNFDASLYAALALRGTKIPLVATFHGASDVERFGWRNRLKWWVLRRAAAVACVSQSLAERARRVPGVLDERVVAIYNGIDLAANSERRSDELRRSLGVADDTLLIGALGNIRPTKGYEVLLDAIAILRDEGVSSHLVIAGDDRFEPTGQLRAQARRLNVHTRVTFLGFTNDGPGFLNGLDIFVLSSHTEGFSISTVQAMACGLPVVATRSGGPEELVEDEISGILVKAGSARALADGLRRFALDAQLRTRMGIAASSRARARFSVEAMLDAYAALYTRVTHE